MHRYLTIAILCLAGCWQPPSPTPEPAPSDAHAAVVESVAKDYCSRLAVITRDIASKADTYKSNADIYDAMQSRTTEAHKAAFKALADAENALVKPDGDYDATAIRKMLESEAVGWEAAAK